MEPERKFGLIGKNISYSFSKKYFEQKFQKLFLKNYSYSVFDINEISEVENILNQENLRGLNVTIPYKESILSFLDELSEEAQEIGAVNTILIENNKKTGYNTDCFGFEKTLHLHLKPHHKSALILGDGGAAKAVEFVLKKNNIPYVKVSRKSDTNFQNLDEKTVSENLLIIQCTPVGTFPNVEDCLQFPFSAISGEHLVIDLIYNPEYTQFIKNCAENGAKTANGLYMLEQQAEKAWEIWTKEE